MARWIVGSRLRLRLVVATPAGVQTTFNLKRLGDPLIDAMPQFSRPYVKIQSAARGFSAEAVETMIAAATEAEILNGAP